LHTITNAKQENFSWINNVEKIKGNEANITSYVGNKSKESNIVYPYI